jgi:hypothetical protein
MKKIGLFVLTLLVLCSLLNSAPVLAAKSDFQTFDPLEAHYTGVILQQGRVQLDEDFNEEVELELYALDLGLADEVYAKKITDDPCKWVFLGHLINSGEWGKNIFHLDRELYPAVQEGLRLLIDINADSLTPTYLEYSKLAVVPAPGTFLLLATGLLGLARRVFGCKKQDYC